VGLRALTYFRFMLQRTRFFSFPSFAIVFLLLMMPISLFAQHNTEALKHARSGYELEQQKKFREALYEYNASIAADPKYPYPLSRIANMYWDLHNYPVAIRYYSRAIALDSNFDISNFYNLGYSYKSIQNFDSAVIAFKEFIRRMQPASKADTLAMIDADSWIKFTLGCEAERAKPKNTQEPVPIFGEINSPYDDFGPTITADGETLYFTSRRPSTNHYAYEETKDYGDDLFVTHRDSARNWVKPTALPPPINSVDDEGAASISADGQTVFYSLCRRPDGIGDCDLYFSELVGDQWTRPQNLGAQINSKQWDAEPSVTADGNTMYFASKRSNSIDGSEDIWVAYKGTDGSWSKPVNLGEPVNTKFSERSPFIAADGKTLYFSSNGHPGFGNHDLFISKKLEDGTWSVPINLGSPINTFGDDEFLTIPARGDKMYFCSQRNNPKGNLDIFEATLPKDFRPGPVTVVAGMVLDKKSLRPLGAKIEVTDLKSHEIVAIYRSNSVTGKFFITLGTGKSYGITATAPNYAFYSENYTVPDTISYRELSHDLPLIRVDSLFADLPVKHDSIHHTVDTTHHTVDTTSNTGQPENFVLNNIFFDFNKATLRDESIPELKNLVRFLNQYPKFRIEIAGHTDSLGTDQINKKLSQERAETIRSYLIINGIAANRMTARGYGSTQPVAANDTEEGRQKNRRTTFRILQKK
jgi:outer membrane protein OmpA-like peptidoglycan-associated protein/tetratricopeptide (TPR) repeat protein